MRCTEMPTVRVLFDIESRGMAIDVRQLKSYERRLRTRLLDIEARVNTLAGGKIINLRAGKSCR